MIHSRLRADRDGALHEVDRDIVAAGAIGQHPHQMQRLVVQRLRGQDLPAENLGIAHATVGEVVERGTQLLFVGDIFHAPILR